jgi:anti-sigma regulatory factor (Ser/Thr protein kinase)
MRCAARVDFEMRRAMPASFEAAEEFIADFRQRSQALLDRVGCFAAELLVREALTNAVVHGGHTNPAKQIRCCLRLKGGRLLIAVWDDGDGFDWHVARADAATSPDCSGRGIEILLKYASRVRYNAGGNAVTIIKRFC